MPRFFIEDIAENSVTITGEDARHIARSLRCRVGDTLTLCDGKGVDCHAVISEITDIEVVACIAQRGASRAEPPIPITLYQAMPKGDKLDLIIQKAVELGVHRIVTVITDRCVSRPDVKSMPKKLERLQKISLEAAKQSGRGIIPTVDGLLTLSEAVTEMRQCSRAILFYEDATVPLGEVLAGASDSIAILIGSEGGFAPDEVQYCTDAGLHICTMGPRILRCETAPLYALSAITYQLENR